MIPHNGGDGLQRSHPTENKSECNREPMDRSTGLRRVRPHPPAKIAPRSCLQELEPLADAFFIATQESQADRERVPEHLFFFLAFQLGNFFHHRDPMARNLR